MYLQEGLYRVAVGRTKCRLPITYQVIGASAALFDRLRLAGNIQVPHPSQGKHFDECIMEFRLLAGPVMTLYIYWLKYKLIVESLFQYTLRDETICYESYEYNPAL